MSPTPEAGPAEGAEEALRYRFADVDFDCSSGELRVAGRPVVVEPRPLRLLQELLRHVGEVVTKEELLDSVWEGRPTVDHVLANAVSKLRSALGEQGAARLQTLPRVGYRLAGPVQRLAQRTAETVLQAGQLVPGREGYVLELALGGGTHSDVWRARHTKLGQTHIFKFATESSRLAALKREYTLYRVITQELGPRDDIARVVDTNFIVAPFFIECEDGGDSLLHWAATPGRLASLAAAERLGLFLQIARAVAAAHSVGVLHKDLKPGNVLIEALPAEDGQPPRWAVRLTDFGSGRLLDPAQLEGLKLTALGMTQTRDPGPNSSGGTPLYMAPELLTGQGPTVQSDVYALGLMLWQLMVGDLQRPMATGWQREIDDELLCEDIAAATEGRPDQRLKSAAELVDRLQALPARRAAAELSAVQARQAAQTAAALQRVRLRRPWLAAALLSLAFGLALSLWSYRQTLDALRQAERQALRAEAINQFLGKDVLASPLLGHQRSGGALTLVDVLARASQSASERFRDQPETEAAVRLQLAQAQAKLKNVYLAADEFERALTLWAGLHPPEHPQRLLAQFGLSSALYVLSRHEEAKLLLDDGQRRLSPALAAAHPVLAQAAQRADYDRWVARRDYKAALASALKLQQLVDGEPAAARDERIEARLLRAEMNYQLGDMTAAAQVLNELSRPPLEASGAGPVLQARTWLQQARQHTNRGELPAAEALLLRARDTLLASAGAQDFYTGIVHAELAELYTQNEPVKAVAALDAALVALRASLGPDHMSVRMTVVNQALLELGHGDVARALGQLEAQRPWFAAQSGKSAQHILQAIDFRRATAMTMVGRAAEALPILQGIDDSALAQASWGADWPLKLKAERALALLALQRRDEGLQLLDEAVQGMRSTCYMRSVCDGYAKQLQQLRRAGGVASRG